VDDELEELLLDDEALSDDELVWPEGVGLPDPPPLPPQAARRLVPDTKLAPKPINARRRVIWGFPPPAGRSDGMLGV